MDFARLREIDLWFRTRWLIFALAALADKPLRYTDLRRAVREHTATNVSDTTINRLLEQLLDAGLATRTSTRSRTFRRQHVYALTEQGRDIVAEIDTLTETLRARRTTDPGTQPAASGPD